MGHDPMISKDFASAWPFVLLIISQPNQKLLILWKSGCLDHSCEFVARYVQEIVSMVKWIRLVPSAQNNLPEATVNWLPIVNTP